MESGVGELDRQGIEGVESELAPSLLMKRQPVVVPVGQQLTDEDLDDPLDPGTEVLRPDPPATPS